jgi:hypothetical protein
MRRLCLLVVGVVLAFPGTAVGASFYVAPTGSNANSGKKAAPWRTVASSLPRLHAGDTLWLRRGTYTENVSVTVTPATAAARTRVRAYPGERPVIVGKLWVQNASYWTFSGVNVTWGTGLTSDQQMVRIIRAHHWRYTNSELWNAHSTAALGINPGAYAFRVDHNYIHDTVPSNYAQQDHLIYCETDALYGLGGTGVIERNLLVGSPNGRAVKIGKGSGSRAPTGGVTVRYNTMVDDRGPAQIQLSYGAANKSDLSQHLRGHRAVPERAARAPERHPLQAVRNGLGGIRQCRLGIHPRTRYRSRPGGPRGEPARRSAAGRRFRSA